MIKELDVQTIPPRNRHPLIFQTFDEMAVGDTLAIINDHDPKPLIYQFMHERPEQFAYEYIDLAPKFGGYISRKKLKMETLSKFVVPSLLALMPTVQTDSITSRTIHKAGAVNAVLFAFDTGQALTEHRSAYTAILQILEGKATITLGDESQDLETGAWIFMPPQLAHSVFAHSPMKMLLLMLG